MKITFYGAAKTVTGSCYMVDTGHKKILIDCGMFQGSKKIKERNYGEFPFNPREIDLILLTHAHIDHSGLIPKLYKHGYIGPVISTSATVELCTAVLPDSGHIQEMEVERKNRKALRSGKALLEPIYTVEDAQKCLKYFQSVNYEEFWEVIPGITVRFRDAGHILGSAIIELWVKMEEGTTKIVFTGDLGNNNQPIIKDPSLIDFADYIIIESTYGNRLHTIKTNRLETLAEVICDTFKKGGNLVIPAFAIERTQDLLYDLNLLIERGDIEGRDIYIDSPLAITATEIFCRNYEYFDSEAAELRLSNGGVCPLFLPGLHISRSTEESMALNKRKGGAIIISASGMADAGRIKHHLKHNIWRPESTVLFVGYQAQGTLGRRILDGEKLVRIHGEEIMVRADIRNIDGFSAHADQENLLKWVSNFKKPPKKVFVTHGEKEGATVLANLLSEKLQTEAVVPDWQETYNLAPNLTENTTKVPEPSLETLTELNDYIKRKLDNLTLMQNNNPYEVFNILKKIKNELDHK